MFRKIINSFKAFLNSVFVIEATVGVEPKQQELFTSMKPRKRRDCTKITQYHYDYICSEYKEWKLANKDKPLAERETSQEFIQRINEKMGMNKSYRALCDVWSGRVERDSLPTGTPSFEF
ncbi:MAG: hypothetical protein ACRBB6_04115 [Neptuniibacter sp.]